MIARARFVSAAVCLVVCATAGTATAGIPSWTTYHHDGGRSGIDPDSTSPMAPAQVWQSSPALDGSIYGQPLVYGSDVYVATENDTVYALDASTGAIVWQKHLATAVPSGRLPCGNISPEVGITSTPVIDPSTGRIYVVTESWDGSSSQSISHQLFGLNLGDGSPAPGLPIAVDPSGSTPSAQLQRASLALEADKVIIGLGGNYGDCGSYHGWLVAAPEGGGAMQTFEVDRSTSGGAIWASGNAPPIDSAGDVWTATGNGSSSSFDNQESVVKLDPNLNVLDHWAPSNWSSLDSSDTDLGSSMPLLLPGGLVFQIGKAGVGYLLSGSGLGGTGGAPLYQASVCNGSYGGGIYTGGVIYVACSNGLHALSLDTTARRFAPASGWSVNSNVNGPPIFAGGLVWSAGTGNGTLYGLDPASGATKFSASLGGFQHFSSPSAGGGRLFVANRTQVTALQIAAIPGKSSTTVTLASSKNPSTAGKAVTYTATVAPAPDSGTVAFADGGAAIAGCSAVAVNTSSGQAACTTSYGRSGSHAIVASYSGDAYFAGSGSAALSEVVVPNAPVISQLRASGVRRQLRLRLILSEPAKLTVVLSHVVLGRVVHRRCRSGARYGKRCARSMRWAALQLRGKRGYNTFKLRTRTVAPGSYSVTVTARDAAGRRSQRYVVAVVVRRP